MNSKKNVVDLFPKSGEAPRTDPAREPRVATSALLEAFEAGMSARLGCSRAERRVVVEVLEVVLPMLPPVNELTLISGNLKTTPKLPPGGSVRWNRVTAGGAVERLLTLEVYSVGPIQFVAYAGLNLGAALNEGSATFRLDPKLLDRGVVRRLSRAVELARAPSWWARTLLRWKYLGG